MLNKREVKDYLSIGKKGMNMAKNQLRAAIAIMYGEKANIDADESPLDYTADLVYWEGWVKAMEVVLGIKKKTDIVRLMVDSKSGRL